MGKQALAARNLHAVDKDGTHGLGTVVIGIGPDGLDALEHVLHIAGDGDFIDGEGDFAVLHPEAAGARE